MSAVYLPTNAEQTKEHQSLYAYDDRHRLTGITHQLCTISAGHACASTTATGSVTYEHDDNDNRTRVDEDNGATGSDLYYCHDARNQLIGRGSTAVCGTADIETFAYDDAGNRTQAVEAGVTRNFAYTPAGLLCDVETNTAASCTGGNIASDEAGRISDHAGWHFLYDAKARLVSACDDDDCVGSGFDRVDFTYDGEGHRTAIVETPAAGSPVVTTTFRYQGDAIVAEYVGGTLTRKYVTDDTGTISKVIVPSGGSAGTYLVTWNGHGDAMALHRIETNGTLTLANSYAYSTWGTPTTATHNGVADLGFRFLYVGSADVQWDDAFGLGLAYMHARHYSPTLGRFLQPDPSRLDAQLFVYAENSPVSKGDPTGHLTIVATMTAYKLIETFMLRQMQAHAAPCEGCIGYSIYSAAPTLIFAGLFYLLVRPGGRWDYKEKIRELAGKTGTFWTPVDGYSRNYVLKYDVWANIHYGYVGRAWNFPAIVLSALAHDQSVAGWRSDDQSVRVGMGLWERWNKSINAARLNAAIRASMPTWLSYKDGGVRYVGAIRSS